MGKKSSGGFYKNKSKNFSKQERFCNLDEWNRRGERWGRQPPGSVPGSPLLCPCPVQMPPTEGRGQAKRPSRQGVQPGDDTTSTVRSQKPEAVSMCMLSSAKGLGSVYCYMERDLIDKEVRK